MSNPKPKLFVSHASEDRELAEQFADYLNDEFDVLLDSTRLKPGYEWKPEIEEWLLDCEAAIILFTQHVLKTNSDWVSKEAWTLSMRHRQMDEDFFLLSVFCDGFDLTKLNEDPRFQPCNLGAIQGTVFDSKKLDFAPIRDALKPVLDTAALWLPWRSVENKIEQLLKPIGVIDYELVAEDLGLERNAFKWIHNKNRWIARKLLRSSLNDVRKFLAKLTVSLKKDCWSILQIVGPFNSVLGRLLVPPKTAEDFSHTATLDPSPVIGLVSRTQYTPEIYVRRSCCREPPWILKMCKSDFDHSATQSLKEEIDALVLGIAGYDETDEPTAEEIDRALAEEKKDNGPLLIILPSGMAAMDSEFLSNIVSQYKLLTFILLSKSADEDLSLRFNNLHLVPALNKDLERETKRIYTKVKQTLDEDL